RRVAQNAVAHLPRVLRKGALHVERQPRAGLQHHSTTAAPWPGLSLGITTPETILSPSAGSGFRFRWASRSMWSNRAPIEAPAAMATLDSPRQPIIVLGPCARAVATRRRASVMPPVFTSLRFTPSQRAATLVTSLLTRTDS